MRLNQESPVARFLSKKQHPGKYLALSFALLGLTLQSCDRAATRPVEEPVSARARIKEDSANHIVVLPSGQTVAFPKKFALPESTMIELAEASVRPPDPALHNQPASTSLARTAASETTTLPLPLHRPVVVQLATRIGVQTIRAWVPDDFAQVTAIWYRDLGNGSSVIVDKSIIKGAYAKQSRTTELHGYQKFGLMVMGMAASPNTRNMLVKVSSEQEKGLDKLTPTAPVFSREARSGGFRADSSVRWLWGGCTTFLVVNDHPSAKDILLIDAYVDKSTAGNDHNYAIKKTERKRVARYVNQIRSLISKGYKISGVIMTHGHGDHAGDLRYILNGIRMPTGIEFMESEIDLTGKPYLEELKVYVSEEAKNEDKEYMVASDRYNDGNPAISRLYTRFNEPKFELTPLTPSGKIYGFPFTEGPGFTYGSFYIKPYIWYHGTTDGKFALNSDVRTIAYRVTGRGTSHPATVFMTGSYIEKTNQLNELNRRIEAHHILFADGGKELTAYSVRHIELLPNPPLGENFIIPTHNDNNSNAYGDMDDNQEEAVDLYYRFFKTGQTDLKDGLTYWHGSVRNIKMGYFADRLGD
ncbi:MAG TPA: MBL fold metallo-hydrolase [Fibrobacteria bacterium]|nr:MBL fold metallo-hydrolase [Fibrobacteria bacterium]